MVGMDALVKLEKPKERDCLCADPLKPNGEAAFHSLESELPGALVVDGKCNGKIAAVSPITPNPCRENGDPGCLTDSSLSSESPKSPNVDGFTSTESDAGVGSGHGNSPRTPEEGVFDPFAPGPEEMLLAPLCKKLVKGSRQIVARRLNFDGDDDDDNDDAAADDSSKGGDNVKEVEMLCEKTVLDTVYGTLLEAIVEDFLADNCSSESKSPLSTPTSSPTPSLTGIAETCPGAPMKGIAGKSRNIDPALCRKLEF